MLLRIHVHQCLIFFNVLVVWKYTVKIYNICIYMHYMAYAYSEYMFINVLFFFNVLVVWKYTKQHIYTGGGLMTIHRGGSSLKNWAMHLWRIWKNEGARRARQPPRAPQARSTLRRGVRGPLKAPGKFSICKCSEMHSPAFSEQLMEHYFHCKFI